MQWTYFCLSKYFVISMFPEPHAAWRTLKPWEPNMLRSRSTAPRTDWFCTSEFLWLISSLSGVVLVGIVDGVVASVVTTSNYPMLGLFSRSSKTSPSMTISTGTSGWSLDVTFAWSCEVSMMFNCFSSFVKSPTCWPFLMASHRPSIMVSAWSVSVFDTTSSCLWIIPSFCKYLGFWPWCLSLLMFSFTSYSVQFRLTAAPQTD